MEIPLGQHMAQALDKGNNDNSAYQDKVIFYKSVTRDLFGKMANLRKSNLV